MKLHRQFAHPTSNKLIKLINSASQEWRNNENLKAEISKVTMNEILAQYLINLPKTSSGITQGITIP